MLGRQFDAQNLILSTKLLSTETLDSHELFSVQVNAQLIAKN